MQADLTLLQMPWPLHLALWPEQKVHGVPLLQLLVADGLVPLHLLSDTCSQAQLLYSYVHCDHLVPLHLLSAACFQGITATQAVTSFVLPSEQIWDKPLRCLALDHKVMVEDCCHILSHYSCCVSPCNVTTAAVCTLTLKL